ncbi:MAG: DUF1998 domain-containing protein [Synechococcaceae cyanobacterium SM1_2_3]|nr:DUF1998 domain-containing protein [Synechococcaceae cyanobacterium SM1_2_3]
MFELQLHDLDGKPIDQVAAYTVAVALRRALCLHLGIEETEVGALAASSRTIDKKQKIASIYLYDTVTGGAGYSTQIVAHLSALLRQARQILECPRHCDAACQSCLLTHDTQHHLDDLNRHTAIALLSDDFLAALELPESLRVFGPKSQLEMEPLILALNREWQHIMPTQLRVYLGGKTQDWELLAWRLRDDLTRWRKTGATIQLIVPATAFSKLNSSQRDEWAALIAYTGAELYRAPDLSKVADLPLIMELGSANQQMRWAASKLNALIPGPHWGSGENGGPFVRTSESQALSPLPNQWKRLSLDELRPVMMPSSIALSISSELNGSSATFGERTWTFLEQRIPALAKRLRGTTPLQSVHYSDRYLCSPLTFVLLHELLNGLTCYSGGLAKSTPIEITTAELNRLDAKQPRLLSHDWRDSEDRRQAIETWFTETWPNFKWREMPLQKLPHARELTLTWNNNDCWIIRLDQGLGYWGIAPGLRPEFPFDYDVAQQIEKLRKNCFLLEPLNPGYPTYWHCSQLKQ